MERVFALIKNQKFVVSACLFMILSGFLFYFLKLRTNFVVEENYLLLSNVSLGIFLFLLFLLSLHEFFNSEKSIIEIFYPKHLLIFFLSTMLVFSMFQGVVGAYGIGIFVGAALFYFAFNRKIYNLNPIFLYIFLFATLKIFGTIGTPQGFRIPETILAFFIVPVSFMLFSLSRNALHRVLRLFVRAMFLYMVVSVFFWFYNFNYLNISLLQWVSSKIDYLEQGSIFNYVIGWGRYRQPTYISIVLLTAMVSAFYLCFSKKNIVKISAFEVFIFVILTIITLFLMESRLGVVVFLIVIFANVLYVVKLRCRRYKLIFFAILLISILVGILSKNILQRVVKDDARRIVYTLSTGYIKDHLTWGCGYGEEEKTILAQEKLMPDVSRLKYFPPYAHTHNQLLGEMMQFGILGGVILLLMYIVLIINAFRNKDYLLLMFLLIFFIAMLIDEPLYIQEGITRFCVFVTFFIALSDSEKRTILLDLSKNKILKRGAKL